MTKRNSLLLSLAAGMTVFCAGLLTGCGDQEAATGAPAAPEASPATAASPAGEAQMGPPPPPATPKAATEPTPFKGTGKVVTTASGIKYEDMTVGTGPAPKEGQYVQVQYIGTGESGQEFDSSFKHGGTFEFQLGAGRVIKGWDIGVAEMKIGGRRKLIIPGNLAYGDAPPPGAPFKPNETLTFDITLLGATDQPTQGGM